jgi:hypothetical protein
MYVQYDTVPSCLAILAPIPPFFSGRIALPLERSPYRFVGSALNQFALTHCAASSTSTEILDVVPAGATVTLTGNGENGFVSLIYQDESGWAYGDYLDWGCQSQLVVPTRLRRVRGAKRPRAQLGESTTCDSGTY